MKLPLSVLVVVHTASLEVLLLERESRAGFWQSVTGSLDRVDEPLAAARARSPRKRDRRRHGYADALAGRQYFEIYARWRTASRRA